MKTNQVNEDKNVTIPTDATKPSVELSAALSEDEGWVRQMAALALKLKSPQNAKPELVRMWCQSLATARRQASESIGNIQVKCESEVYRDEHQKQQLKYFYRPSIKDGKIQNYAAQSQDMAILLALGEKYGGWGNGREFAKHAGRMLGIQDGWCEPTHEETEIRKRLLTSEQKG